MKLISFLSIASLASVVAFAAGLAFNVAALPLFATTAATLVMLTAVADYRAPRDYAACTTIALRRCQVLPLAA
jgi:hypothetical protein